MTHYVIDLKDEILRDQTKFNREVYVSNAIISYYINKEFI